MIDDTDVDSASSVLEAICTHGGGLIQLGRQLTVAALNCINSNAPADCFGVPGFDVAFATCDSVCEDGIDGGAISGCIDIVDCLNNGGQPSLNGGNEFFCASGICADNGMACTNGDLASAMIRRKVRVTRRRHVMTTRCSLAIRRRVAPRPATVPTSRIAQSLTENVPIRKVSC